MDPTQRGTQGTPPPVGPACEPPETDLVSAADPLDNQPQQGPVLAYSRPPRVGTRSRSKIWARRTWMIITVLFCMELGLLLIVLPWKSSWTNGPILLRFPELRPLIGNYFFRGLLTGLGVVDLWIGIWEAVHYTDEE